MGVIIDLAFCSQTSRIIYLSKKETSDCHGTVSFDLVKILQQ